MAEDRATPLWNTRIGPRDYGPDLEKYQTALLEQYRIAIEMADRVSARRGLTNTFFLALNTGVVAAVTAFLAKSAVGAVWVSIIAVALCAQCVIWYGLLNSYRRLNSTKYRIIGELEQGLPVQPWTKEWNTLGDTGGLTRYWRLGLMERLVPVVFLLVYIALGLAALIAG